MKGVRSAAECALAAALVASAISMGSVAQAADTVNAVTVLNSLPVSNENRSGYSRELFRHWVIDPSTGCDTRELVLIDERVSGAVRGCSVVGGVWRSSYDGATTSNPSTFDIDHVVPLAEAWDSGAWRWSSGTRQAYANDRVFGGSLIAVTASSNRSKGDQDPSEWLPQQRRCSYAKTWVAVKFRWRLAVDATEKSALNRILAACSPTMALPARAAVVTTTVSPADGSPGSSAPSNAASDSTGRLDPRFGTCGEAIAAGYGPYTQGRDAEYEWYIDRDSDGSVCES